MDQNRYAEVGQFIRSARESRKLSLEQAAREMEKLGVPTSKTVLHRLEKGEGITANFGDATFVRALTQILGISQMELLVMTGHIPFRELKFGADKQHLAELLAVMDDDTLAAAEQVLEVLVAQQRKASQS
jgi:transcriptional regulator with XRE-family HTH domain